jgi:hypothetical protein
MHNPPTMIPARRVFLVAAALAALIGCGSANDDRPQRWSFISATITEPSCATVNCHSQVAKRGGVDLHDRATGYTDLTTRGFVNPTTPDQSPILFLMRGEGSLRMPPDMPLPADDIVLIENWIKDGAKND